MGNNQSGTQDAAVQNFEKHLSAVAKTSIISSTEFKALWQYLRHLPQMQPFAEKSMLARLNAAIELTGTMHSFEIESAHSWMDDGEDMMYIGYTESCPPDKALDVTGIDEHSGEVRKALETAIYLLLHEVGCIDLNGRQDYFIGEDDEETEIVDMVDLTMDDKAFEAVCQRRDELGDWCRHVKTLAGCFSLESIQNRPEEGYDAEELYPICYQHPNSDGHFEMIRHSGWGYTPAGRYYILSPSGLCSDMPPINPEKYLNKIFHFNLKTLRYGL